MPPIDEYSEPKVEINQPQKKRAVSQLINSNHLSPTKHFLLLSPSKRQTPHYNYLQLMQGCDQIEDEDDIERGHDHIGYGSYGEIGREEDRAEEDEGREEDLDIIDEEYYQQMDDEEYDDQEAFSNESRPTSYLPIIPSRKQSSLVSYSPPENDYVSQIQAKLFKL